MSIEKTKPLDISEQLPTHLTQARTLQEVLWVCEGHNVSEDLLLEIEIRAGLVHGTPNPDFNFGSEVVANTISQIEQRIKRLSAEYKQVVRISNKNSREYPYTDLHRILPETLTEELGQESIEPIAIIIPGTFVGPEQLAEFSESLALHGHPILAPEMYPTSSALPDFNLDKPIQNSKVVNAYAGATEAALLRQAEQNPGAKTDLIAYSVGAVAAVATALKHPQTVRSIVLVNPTGLNQSNNSPINLPKTILGAAKHMIQTSLIASTPSFDRTFIKNWAERQKNRGLSEVIDILKEASGTELQDAISYLQVEHGIKVSVVSAADDKQIDSKVSQIKAKEVGADTLLVAGTHTNIGREPNALAAYVSGVIAHINRNN